MWWEPHSDAAFDIPVHGAHRVWALADRAGSDFHNEVVQL